MPYTWTNGRKVYNWDSVNNTWGTAWNTSANFNIAITNTNENLVYNTSTVDGIPNFIIKRVYKEFTIPLALVN